MYIASSMSNLVREANSVAGFGLDLEFADTLSTLLAKCRAAGLDFRLSQGLRTPQKQAEYYCSWRQRTPAPQGQNSSKPRLQLPTVCAGARAAF